jgi:Domain of unknown function (DUF397)
MGDWRKSSFSDSTGGQCVETANGSSTVSVRDTTDRAGFILEVPAHAWVTFTAGLK